MLLSTLVIMEMIVYPSCDQCGQYAIASTARLQHQSAFQISNLIGWVRVY